MLRALLFLLSCDTDGEIIADLAHRALIMGLVNVSVLGCIGVRIAIGHWLANRGQPVAPHDALE
jgi:hypothetical protein